MEAGHGCPAQPALHAHMQRCTMQERSPCPSADGPDPTWSAQHAQQLPHRRELACEASAVLQGALDGLQSLLMPLKLWPMRIDTPLLGLIIMQQVSRHTTLAQLQQARYFARPADDEAESSPAQAALLPATASRTPSDAVASRALRGSAHAHEPMTKRRAVPAHNGPGQLAIAPAAAPAPAPPAAADPGTYPTAAARLQHVAAPPAHVRRAHEGSEPDPGVRRLGGLGSSASWQGVRAADAAASWQGAHAADEAAGSKAAAWRPVGPPGRAPDSHLQMPANMAERPPGPLLSGSAPQDDAVVPQLPSWVVQGGMASTPQVWGFLPGSLGPGLPNSLPGPAKKPVTQRRDDSAEPLLSETVAAPRPHLAASLGLDMPPARPEGSIGRVLSLGDPAFAPLVDELLSWQ